MSQELRALLTEFDKGRTPAELSNAGFPMSRSQMYIYWSRYRLFRKEFDALHKHIAELSTAYVAIRNFAFGCEVVKPTDEIP